MKFCNIVLLVGQGNAVKFVPNTSSRLLIHDMFARNIYVKKILLMYNWQKFTKYKHVFGQFHASYLLDIGIWTPDLSFCFSFRCLWHKCYPVNYICFIKVLKGQVLIAHGIK
jgi:hypothetical protein